MEDLRSLIREVLKEELSRLRPDAVPAAARITEEVVSLRSSTDLNEFACRVLNMAQDGRLRADILEGRHRFCLSGQPAVQVEAHQPIAPAPSATPVQQFTRGIVSERDVAALPQGTRRIQVGKPVKFTPLARDEIRRRGIKVERTSS
ncbi:hypothetical protein PEL8287_02588 [Roseovarius litorisediminis]|uniref:Uncharacterized protein n=1 Tax=Roseovarius litorisediminis TaxID=1312363 RepID=A0A1Y5T117_9RHOB|nr:hypothetical protein [Roseovarius litorisediminis]SLN49653.1 hypothetical protein PEL8287_02588 [Roseovarius litorisediminis]